ncbi:MAG TPA: DUF6600 domain-containing protein [Candidatus Limnocylindria bacterium]|nr:DUF6600 domain-containing protein [Candidatus Limnocylindria bacterium]
MKTRIGQTLAAVLLTLTLDTHFIRAADEVTVTNTAPVQPALPPTNPAAVAAPESTKVAPAQVISFPKPGLPPLLDQVVHLSASGADEVVIRAYIEKAAPPYRITGNEIVQLHDLGISPPVIMSLIEHSQTAEANTAGPISSSPVTQTAEAAGPPAPEQTSVQTDSSVASVPDAAPEFTDSLAPYGSWLDVPGYGQCWQPTVVVVNPSWRPYCDNGGWAWSDAGWYWNSYYSWGWAPFHYGRWFSYPSRGWLWCPDRVWGPSWVSWRNSGSWCGWAPLPPKACFSAGIGWTFGGARVGVDCGFGLRADHFTFVAHKDFASRQIGVHALRGSHANAAFQNTTVINNYAVGANNRIINQGMGRQTIAAAGGTPIREVALNGSARGANLNRVPLPSRVNHAIRSDAIFGSGQQISAARINSAGRVNNTAAVAQRAPRPASPSIATSGTRTPSVPRTQPQPMPARSVSRSPAVAQNRVANVTGLPRVSAGRPAVQVQSIGRSYNMPRNAAPRVSAPSSFGRPMASVGRTSSVGRAPSAASVSRGSVSAGRTSAGRMSAARR